MIVTRLSKIGPRNWIPYSRTSHRKVRNSVRSGLPQQLPGNQAVHPFQEEFPAGLAFLALVLQIGKSRLVHLPSLPQQALAGSAKLCHKSPALFRGFLGESIVIPSMRSWSREAGAPLLLTTRFDCFRQLLLQLDALFEPQGVLSYIQTHTREHFAANILDPKMVNQSFQ